MWELWSNTVCQSYVNLNIIGMAFPLREFITAKAGK